GSQCGYCTPGFVMSMYTLAFFASGVYALVRPIERDRQEGWVVLGVLGIVFQNGVFTVVIATDVVLLMLADSLLTNAGTTEAVWNLQRALFTLNGTAIGIAFFGLSMATLRAGIAPKWHSYGGIIGSVAFLLSAIFVVAALQGSLIFIIGLVGFILWLLWILIMGIQMAIKPVLT
ncbi:MAG: DUF4386 family protein, partial [Dehalococcoidia bacterium]